MRRFAIFPMLLVVLVVLPTGASAKGLGAPDFRDRVTDQFVEDNFCDTGVSVDVVESGVFNGWESEDTFTMVFRQRVAFTYGDTTVYLLNAGRVDEELVEGEFPGPRTDLVVENGLRSRLLVPGQGAVTLDHGYIEYLVSFDENGEFVDVDVVLKDAGGHPDFYDPVFCEAAIEALGIPTA